MTDIERFLTIYGHSDNLLNNNDSKSVDIKYLSFGQWLVDRWSRSTKVYIGQTLVKTNTKRAHSHDL